MALLHPSSVPHGRTCRLMAVVAACLLLLSGSCDAARRLHLVQQQSPWSYIKTTPGLETLATLVQAANLSSALDSVSLGYTLFLPNNQSFALLETEQGISVAALKNSSALRGVLLYHVFAGAALSPAALTIGKRLLMGSGDNITITQALEIGLPLGFSDAMGRVAAPVTLNVTLGTSVGYVINRVLLPITPTTIDEALSYESSMSQIQDILRAMAVLEKGADDKTFTNLLYSNKTNVTFLVPTDDAFSAMCVNVTDLFNNTAYLRKLLLSHFLPGSLDFAALVALNGANITTLAPPARFQVQVMYGTIVLYGSNVSSTLIMTPNLVGGKSFLHSINTLLMPSDPSKPTFSCPPAPPNDDYSIRNSFYYDPAPADDANSTVPSADSSTVPSEDTSDLPSAH